MKTKIEYDLFQKDAFKHIQKGHSVIVSAPTGAGKTAIAEHVIETSITSGTKVVYTSPIKALSNQKYRDFQSIYPGCIGLLTGDVTINPSAPVLIMTTEIFRNKVLGDERLMRDYSWVIFDEIHYIDDYERGTVWEESLLFLPSHMKILALSATIPNLKEFADWLQSIHKNSLKIVKEDKRPVPLHLLFQCEERVCKNLEDVKKTGYTKKGLRISDNERVSIRYKTHQNRPTVLIRNLYNENKLPCIYFLFARRRCELLAKEMSNYDFLNINEKQEIRRLHLSLCCRYSIKGEQRVLDLQPLIEKGIAYHHAGMMPILKEVIERLFTSKLIKVIFTTETFALGINMPAKTVCFDELRKFYGFAFSTLKTRDFYQMAGRAGRRGIDTEGYVYSRINPHYISIREIKRIIYGEPEKIYSRFNTSYSTLLLLYDKHEENLYNLYPSSFHYFQKKGNTRSNALEQMKARVRILKYLGYIRKNKLTRKGFFASRICGYELPLAQLYEDGMLENLSVLEIGIICLSIVYEPRKGISGFIEKPDKRIKNIINTTKHTMKTLTKMEKKARIHPYSKGFDFQLNDCIKAWMNGGSFEDILSQTNADEGEIVRFFRMAVQIMREILDADISEKLQRKIKKAITLVNRDIVDAENQLRS
ncbi:MAG: DEAD/DEAH box helicase [Candidatus Theseobacter exili]|nr:DEAD/DEAH box helicase [Candidatus Theseobacter exili]